MDLDEDLLVGEAPDQALGERDFEIGGDRLGEGAVGVSGNQLHARVSSRCRNPAVEPAGDAAAL